MSNTFHPSCGTLRVPSPTPTAIEAQGNIYLARRRLRHLCAGDSQPEVEELLQQWSHPTSDTLQGCGALAQAARNGHISLLEYLVGRGFSLLEVGPDMVPDAASEYAVRTGDTAILDLLLQHGWDPRTRIGSDRSSLE